MDLLFERATNLAALDSFECGVPVVDEIIREALPMALSTNDLFLVRNEQEVVALYCIQKENYSLFLSDEAKESMQEGSKPKPHSSLDEGSDYWNRFFYDSVELTLLAVKKELRGRHIGSFIIEHVLDILANDPEEKRELLVVRALNDSNYSAIPFYRKCGFFPAIKERPGENLIMYHIIPANPLR